MGIDIRNKHSGLDRNKYYKGEYVNNMVLNQGAESQGVFYSKDVEPTVMTNIVVGGVKHKQYIAKIETLDYIPDLELDYYVIYDSELWIVQEITAADIVDIAKPFKRHAYKYTITLRR